MKCSAERQKGTEVNMLSGMTRKSCVRSTFYWLTESCNPQLLPHFVAPFIVSSPRHPSPEVVFSLSRFATKWNGQLRTLSKTNTQKKWQANLFDRSQQTPPPLATHEEAQKRDAHGHNATCTNMRLERANDPSTGSPTETLLRLLLPLRDEVHFERHVLQG